MRFHSLLWGTFAVIWIALGIAPLDRATWALENVLVLVAAIAAIALRRHFHPSRTAWILLFVFLVLHEVGAHYTYSKVPYEAWLEALTGHTLRDLLGFERNHFDRLVHFGGGLLLSPMIRELLATFSRLSLLGCRIGAISAVMSASMVYELIEWGAAAVFGDGVGAAYLGTQGDQWDAHKDMALATLGAVITEGLSWLRMRGRRAPDAHAHPH
jgi:putative membrane protein